MISLLQTRPGFYDAAVIAVEHLHAHAQMFNVLCDMSAGAPPSGASGGGLGDRLTALSKLLGGPLPPEWAQAMENFLARDPDEQFPQLKRALIQMKLMKLMEG